MKPVQLAFTREGGGLAAWLYGHTGSSRRRAPVASALLAAGAIALCVVGWASWEAQKRVRIAKQEIQTLHAQQGNTARRTEADAGKHSLSEQQRRDWNRVVRQLNTPWSAILDALETSLPDGVALVSIEPDTTHGRVRLQVEAKTLDALLGYATTLKAAERLEDVVLVKHETNEQDPTHPVRLSLDARLKPHQSAAETSKERAR